MEVAGSGVRGVAEVVDVVVARFWLQMEGVQLQVVSGQELV